MLITSVKRDRWASRQERKKQNNKIKKKHNTHTQRDRQWHLGQAQGKQAVQRQAGSEHPASHKAAFSYRKKKTIKSKKDSLKEQEKK